MYAEPQPGDVFREYLFTYRCEQIRVGHPNKNNKEDECRKATLYKGDDGKPGGFINYLHDIDLEGAERAECVVEKALVHDQTKGLSISWNDNEWLLFPEAAGIAKPQQNYQHHIFPSVKVPLSHLMQGSENKIKLRVDLSTGWWPQNIVYGIHLRIYYGSSKPHPTGTITSPASDGTLGLDAVISADAESDVGIDRVEFIGFYEDVNYKGDGNYRQWQYRYVKGELKQHLGTASDAPYSITWENSWVPDQEEPMKIAARIFDSDGVAYMTAAVDGLKLLRSGIRVELCKPYDIPRGWVTRKGTKSEKFDLAGDLTKAKAAQGVVCVWKYEYEVDVRINGSSAVRIPSEKLLVTRGPIPVDVLKEGTNTLAVQGGGHHGVEINWPGVMVLVQYEGPAVESRAPHEMERAAEPAKSAVTWHRSADSHSVRVNTAARYRLRIRRPDGRIAVSHSAAGPREIPLRLNALPAGVYVVELEIGNTAVSRRVLDSVY